MGLTKAGYFCGWLMELSGPVTPDQLRPLVENPARFFQSVGDLKVSENLNSVEVDVTTDRETGHGIIYVRIFYKRGVRLDQGQLGQILAPARILGSRRIDRKRTLDQLLWIE